MLLNLRSNFVLRLETSTSVTCVITGLELHSLLLLLLLFIDIILYPYRNHITETYSQKN